MSKRKTVSIHKPAGPKAIKRFTLQFGLVCVPVNLHTAAKSKSKDLAFNQLHATCNSRVKQQLVCPTCDATKALDRSEIVKGFEYMKDQYIVVQEEELDALALPSNSTIAIQRFVPAVDVDPVYFDGTYWLTPDDQGGKPYALLQQVMADTNQAALATITIRKKEQPCLVRAHEGVLLVHTLFNKSELLFQAPDPMVLSPDEQAMATKLVQAMSNPFEPVEHEDKYETAVRALLESRLKGEAPPELVTAPSVPMLDLTAMLEASMAAAQEA